MSEVLWSPSDKRKKLANFTNYQTFLKEEKLFSDSHDIKSLYDWSVNEGDLFWSSVIDFFDIKYSGELPKINSTKDFLDYNWFPEVQINFAENLLSKGNDADLALEFIHESGYQKSLTYGELKKEVEGFQALIKDVLDEGDVLGAYMPNIPETVVGMLATSSLGGIFTSTSCDFGTKGVLDRFGQTEPKVLLTVPYYMYNGKYIDLKPAVEEIVNSLPSLKKVIYVDFLNKGESIGGAISYGEVVRKKENAIVYKSLPFSHPLYVMYSSGTTGKPKCIVHSAGGTLLQHVKELGLHVDLKQNDSLLYFTTCGWMMWNWLVSGLCFGSKIVLYEGSPAFPTIEAFIKKINDLEVSIWGTSPKFLKALEDVNYDKNYDLKNLKTILTTGAPLLPEQFDFVYKKLKSDVMLSSICGGTDIIGCFMLGHPLLPVRRGEITTRGLGMAVEVFNADGEAVFDEEGELVCTKSFPSQPVGFWNDDNQEKFKEAYFEKNPGVWTHGDFIKLTENGGVIVYGRSDATLNPGGVRIGTAEIYRQVEVIDFVEDSLAIGVSNNGDVEIYLFVKVGGDELTEEMIAQIKSQIRKELTPRHVPSKVFKVQGIPYTRSGKKMELPITRIFQGRSLQNIEAVSNPEVLDEYHDLSRL